MFKITQTVAGAATLVLAALPMVALSTAAHAAPQTVQVSDLNLASPAGQQALGHRVDKAARDFCRNQEATSGRINARAACLSGIRAEASEKVAALREMNLASR
ncbi:MAG TPA: UrcA family protein [Phenylobacterium sp.]|nr:UrcA family protein [Phenylobacterium sp.]